VGGSAAGFGRAGGGMGASFGNDQTTTAAIAYVKQHGGGTVAVSSQSSAASAIIASGAKVAGIGGFSGRESDVSVAWLAQRISSGSIRWVLAEQTGQSGGARLPGDNRAGSKAAMTAVAKACRKVTLSSSTTTAAATSVSTGTGASGSGAAATLYDCQGRAAELAAT
jgi:hypothetical protein